ncbi:MAG: aldehyde ferredoxin oxidoreductase family protein, partial [Candidatus Bipolaricaulota bacterium]
MRGSTALHVDLHASTFERKPIPSGLMQKYIGGRGTNMAHLLQSLSVDVPALDPSTPLLFAAGPLVGTSFPGGARFNASGRSPQTGILGDSNAGGFFGPELRFAGIDQLVITGRASRPSILWIDDEIATLVDAGDLWGLDTVEATAGIHALLGDPDIQIATIGPAAENGVAFSGVFANLVRAAARTGMGTLMASKNLKAVAVRGTQGVNVHDPKRFRAAIDRLQEKVLGHSEYKIRTRLGTTQLITLLQKIGGLPTRHFQSTTFERAEAVSGERIEAIYKVRSKACFACSIPCSRYLKVDDDRFPGLRLEGPEYEPLAGFTVRVGVDDLPLALHAVDRCNRLGMDAISVSEVIAWAMECSQRGLLPASEVDGLDLRFGNGGTVLELIEKIASRDGLGDVLADGVRAAAQRLGMGAEWAMEVKGLELFQADPRAMKGYALGNAVASRGADHLRSEPWFEFSGDRKEGVRRYGIADTADRLAWRGKGLLVKDFEEKAAIADALGVCKNTYNNMEVLDWDETAELLEAATGVSWSGEDVRLAGERIVNTERMINARFGIDRRHDTLPNRFLQEPAGPADSPSSGSVVELENMLDEYYVARGWDVATGLPTREKLKELEIGA